MSAPQHQAQQGPRVNLFGHLWGKPYDQGYATCPCGAREDSIEAARDCPLKEDAYRLAFAISAAIRRDGNHVEVILKVLSEASR